MRFYFTGAYDPLYPRNAVLRRGLRELGDEVVELRGSPRLRFWLRYPQLGWRASRAVDAGPSVFFVPEFCQKDVPLAHFISRVMGRPLVFDPLAARYETKILDWGRRPPSSLQAWWNFKIDRWAFSGSDLILADTEAHKAYYCSAYGLDPGKVAVLPVGYDEMLFAPERFAGPEADRPFTVLFCGSFLPLHGVENIIDAARLVGNTDPGVRFVLVGSGQTYPRARRLVEEHGLTNCEFRGWQPLEMIPGEYASADIALGIFGTTEKARRVVPHKVYQALGMGRPVITAATPAADEVLKDGETARLCAEPYGKSLAAAVLELKTNKSLRVKLGKNGLRLARERYSAKPTALRLKKILQERFG
ncbi:MAG: glycosyltransferase family 4 protein [Candidatus Aminicenantes bacterium]|nr:glycosyltransferase family 4 protein [Candidatus Aminicenantes bacterium]